MSDWSGNVNAVWRTIGASNHTENEREKDDYYATSPIAIDKLLTVQRPHKQIWECAAGGGHLSQRLKEFGYEVYSSDIKERGYPLDGIQDFLTADYGDVPFQGDFDIITNPPYKYATEFVLKALELLPKGCRCYMFLKVTFLEGKRRYAEIFSKFPPEWVYVSSERVLCAKNAQFNDMRESGGSALAYAWFVWLKGDDGQTSVEWV